MKKNVIKMAIVAVCVVAAGIGGLNAYNATDQSETNLLLAENVEALSQCDYGCSGTPWASTFYECCEGAAVGSCHYYYQNNVEGLQHGDTQSGYKNK